MPGDLTPAARRSRRATLVGIDLSGSGRQHEIHVHRDTAAVLGRLPTVTVRTPSLVPGARDDHRRRGRRRATSIINVDTGTSRLTLSAPTAGIDLSRPRWRA